MSREVKTRPIASIDPDYTDAQLKVWYNDDSEEYLGVGWYACFSEVFEGLYGESSDFGPHETEEEAWERVEFEYQEWHK
jgi:hypothetical protein